MLPSDLVTWPAMGKDKCARPPARPSQVRDPQSPESWTGILKNVEKCRKRDHAYGLSKKIYTEQINAFNTPKCNEIIYIVKTEFT